MSFKGDPCFVYGERRKKRSGKSGLTKWHNQSRNRKRALDRRLDKFFATKA
jgi:hypothetical protein